MSAVTGFGGGGDKQELPTAVLEIMVDPSPCETQNLETESCEVTVHASASSGVNTTAVVSEGIPSGVPPETSVDSPPQETSGDSPPLETSGGSPHTENFKTESSEVTENASASSGIKTTAVISEGIPSGVNTTAVVSEGIPSFVNTTAVVSEVISSGDPPETSVDSPHVETSGDSPHVETSGDSPHLETSGDSPHIENSGDSQNMETSPKEQPKELNEDPEEWLDILGSGDFKKKVIKAGSGHSSRPGKGDWVTANISCHNNDSILIEKHENFRFRLGDLDVIQGIEMGVSLMELGEKAEILVPARLAYGKHGRKPDIPPDSDLKYEVEVLTVQADDDVKLSFDERLKLGNHKRDQGNFWYGAGIYVNAIQCYQRAAEYLDGIDGSDNPPQKLQEILDMSVKVSNNLAAAHLKLEAYDAALKSLDFVLKMQPSNVKAHFRKAKILATKGMTTDALAEMKVAASLDPESKIIQQKLQMLQKKKKEEDNTQKAMYQRMFPGSTSKPKTERKSWFQSHWSLLAGGMAAVAAGVAAYRQFH